MCYHSNNNHLEKKKNASEDNTYLEGEWTKKNKKQQHTKRKKNHECQTWKKHERRKKMHTCKEEEAPTRRRRPIKQEEEARSWRGRGRRGLKRRRGIVTCTEESLFAFIRISWRPVFLFLNRFFLWNINILFLFFLVNSYCFFYKK